MKKLFFLVAIALLGGLAKAQLKYPVSAIPEALLKNANVVKRMEESVYQIINLHDALYTHKYALTILNEEGQRYADLVVGYDKMRKINDIEGALFDANGIQLKKVKGKDINDYSATSDISLYDDNRMKVHDFEYKKFPYTVEYLVQTEYTYTMGFPDWWPQPSQYQSVEQSSYTFIAPEAYKLRYKTFNYKSEPVVENSKGKKIYTWEIKNLAAIERPFASPQWHELTPAVFLAPSEFEMEGYKGDFSSWQDYGKFHLQLNANRDQLPPATQQKVAQLIQGISEPKEKVKKLYEYLQQNTRYISIQLGIGGLQPFDASYVAQKGYGDCKALSNYMYSLLKSVGIKSYYSLVQGGYDDDDRYMMDDFYSHQFNHIILCVPFAKDSMWLECTSQTDPAGYMGGFTGNRKALLITDEGGKLVPTPQYTYRDNRQLRVVQGSIDEEGGLKVNSKGYYIGEQQDHLFGMISNLSKEEVKKRLNKSMNFSTYEVNDFAYTAKKSQMPEVDENLTMYMPNYATVSGKRIFLVPNIMTKDGHKNIDTANRKADYVFNDAYQDIDSVEITIPKGYRIETLQPPTTLKTKFGNYTSEVVLKDDKIIYYRKIEQWPGRYPATDGAAIVNFYTTVYKTDRSKLVLVKKEDTKATPPARP